MNTVEELAKVKGIGPVTVRRAKAAGVTAIVMCDGPGPSGRVDADQATVYDVEVEWDWKDSKVGATRGGTRVFFMHGATTGRRSDRVNLAGKHDDKGRYNAFTFCPHNAIEGLDVYVNGVMVGKSRTSYTSRYEWGLPKAPPDADRWGVTSVWVRVERDSEWLIDLAERAGKPI